MERSPEPCVVVIFGSTGDLARRKLFPALYNLHRDGLLPEKFALCAYGRKESDDALLRSEIREQLAKYSRRPPQNDWEQLASQVFYVTGEFDDDAGFAWLRSRLQQLDAALGTAGNRLFYFAVGSEFFEPLAQRLARNGLLVAQASSLHAAGTAAPQAPYTRLVLEKPIGHDALSAGQLLKQIAAYASEEQVFRIDHYLGKETVQNILALRFGNCVFEPLWNRNYVSHVEISMAEEEGIGRRAGYYEQAGALRDVVQNHLLQLLCLVAMEAPGTMHADDVRNEKVKVLRNLRKITPAQAAGNTVRGQYGPSADGKLAGYRQEPGVGAASQTESFVALRCFVDTWRWADVPFLLRAGKRLPRRQTEISIHFRVPPLQLFEQVQAARGAAAPSCLQYLSRSGGPPHPACLGHSGRFAPRCVGNVLRLGIQPDEGLSLELAAKIPGAGMRLQNVALDFSYAQGFQRPAPEAYERLLLDALNGDATLFPREDEVQAQWEFIDSILAGWQELPPPSFPNYAAGTWGPDEACKLVPACVGGWHMESARTYPIKTADERR
ncbi:MAG: glucose-6-phosphate dehydrogenase [Planctomycetota bacterium]